MTVFVLSVVAFIRVPLLPEIGRDLTMSAGQLGLVTAMFAMGRLLTDLPAGRALERVRATGLLVTSTTVMAAGSVGLALADRSLMVYGAAFVLGVASAVTNATGMHAFSVAVPKRQRGTSLAVFSTALLAGQALGPVTGGTIAAATSWRGAGLVAGGTCLILVCALVWSRSRQRRVTPGEPVAGVSQPADDRPSPQGWDTQRAALLFVAFAMFFTLGAMPQTLIPLIGAHDFGLRVEWIGAALGLGGTCRLIGGFVGGVAADRVSRRAALLPGLVLQAVGVALIAGTGVQWWLAGIVLMSLASWSISVAGTVLADLAPQGRLGPQLGGFRFVGDVGLILGPVLGTQIYQVAGRAVAAAAIATLLLAAAAWSAISVPETAGPG
jgi:predicted MFS family arabinose efflux permease